MSTCETTSHTMKNTRQRTFDMYLKHPSSNYVMTMVSKMETKQYRNKDEEDEMKYHISREDGILQSWMSWIFKKQK